MEDISIDCETLGLRYDAPVVAVGAVAFDIATGKLGKTFYQRIQLDSAIRSGRVNGKTLQWWMKQSQEARQETFGEDLETLDLASTLANLSSWVREAPPSVRVWANGPAQDITWLEHAYDTGCVGLKEGWYFANVRDMRTLVDVAAFDKSKVPAVGTQHNALADAKWQALVISAAWQKVRQSSAGKMAKPTVEDDEL